MAEGEIAAAMPTTQSSSLTSIAD